MTEVLIDIVVIAAVLVLSLEGGEALVRLMLAAIEPPSGETESAAPGIEVR